MFANLKNSKTHEFNFLQVDTQRAFDSGIVYFISECQGHDCFVSLKIENIKKDGLNFCNF